MWEFTCSPLSPSTQQYQLHSQNQGLTNQDFLTQLSQSEDFRTFYNDLLAQCEFEAFFWEMKPFSRSTLDAKFEFVLVDSMLLVNVDANPTRFQDHFTQDPVVSFPNLGGDAQLIVPTPVAQPKIYTHMARFVRNAPPPQIEEFWKRIGAECQQRVSDRPLWLSTAGLGVSWLHVRIDSRPKYYRHGPYRRSE